MEVSTGALGRNALRQKPPFSPKWANRPKDWNHNLMVLGDFNLDRTGDPLYEAFIAMGLWPPT